MPDGSRPPVWLPFDESRPLAFFAGIWRRWKSVRKVKEGETENDLFAFLTTEPNAIIAPIPQEERFTIAASYPWSLHHFRPSCLSRSTEKGTTF
jgi:putative SOS response-associated peptidase YedK